MRTAGYVFEQVRALLDDQKQQFADDDYLRPFLQIALDDLTNECLRDDNIGQIKAVVVLPAVPAGTQSLGQELLPNGKLALLSDPIEIREKRSGDQDINYVRMVPRLQPIQQSSQNTLNRYYTFTGSDIIIPGASQDLDIWIWGSFVPAPIKDKDTPIIMGVEGILRYCCAKLVADSRGNENLSKKYAGYQSVQQSAWVREIYKINQSVRTVNRPWRPKTSFWFDSPTAY